MKLVAVTILTALSATLAVGSVQAADLYVDPPAAMANDDVFDWTGIYVGAQIGVVRTVSRVDDYFNYINAPFTNRYRVDASTSGLEAGIHAGYNQQFGQFVLGGEGDVNFVGRTTTGIFDFYPGAGGGPFPNPPESATLTALWDASARVKLGYAMDRWLPYVTAGVAVTQVQISQNRGFAAVPLTSTDNLIGYTAGIGLSYAVTDDIILTGEYRHTGYTQLLTTQIAPGNSTSSLTDLSDDRLTVKASFKF